MASEWTPLICKTRDHLKSSRIGALIVCYLELIFGITGIVFALAVLPCTEENGALWLMAFILLLVICPMTAIYGIHQNAMGWVIFFLIIGILNTTINFIQALRISIEQEKTKYAIGQWFIFSFNCCTMMVLYAYCRDTYGLGNDDEEDDSCVMVNGKTTNGQLKYPEI